MGRTHFSIASTVAFRFGMIRILRHLAGGFSSYHLYRFLSSVHGAGAGNALVERLYFGAEVS